VAVLQAGRLQAFGRPGDILDEGLIRNTFGVDSTKLVHPLTGRALIAVAPPSKIPAALPAASR